MAHPIWLIDNRLTGVILTVFSNILKEYSEGRGVSDYKLQHIMMSFSGSQVSISETTGKIEGEVKK